MKDHHKMRAWLECDNQMYYLAQDFGCWIDEDGEPQYPVDDGTLLSLDPVFELCTGLRDKNGTMIYEGDIVFNTEIYNSNPYPVKYNDETGMWKFWNYGMDAWKDVEIIGNIHQNPELLTEETKGE